MTYRDSTGTLTVGGVRIDFESASTLHGVRNPIGQLTFTVMTPLPAALTSGRGPIGKRVVLMATQASHDGVVNGLRSNFRQEAGVIFNGTIEVNSAQSDPSGRTRTFRCEGNLRVLAVQQYEEQAWTGPLSANTVVRGRLTAKGFGVNRADPNRQRPAIFLDELRFPDGSGFTLGGNQYVDDGQIILKDGSSELALIQNIADVPGYALYETPAGPVRLSRVMGIPPAVGNTELFRADGGYRVISATDEGFSFRSEEDTQEVYNYVEVFGVSYQEEDGTGIDVRSFPASIALNLDLDEDIKVRHVEFSSPYIFTQDQADGAREIREQDSSARPRVVTIELDGMPTVYPGHIHKLVAPDLGLNETYFVMTVVHAIDSRGGFRTTVTYRRGAGTARPAGVDKCVFRSLFTSPVHLGDEFVPWYAVPGQQGTSRTWTFTPSVEQTALAFVAEAHGCNSQYATKPPPGGLTGSKILVEQLGIDGTTWERVGENELPVLDERYAEQRQYSVLTNTAIWIPVRVQIAGTVVAGRQVRVQGIAGTDGVGADDFELKNGRLMSCEEGQPSLPSYPKPPVMTTPPRQEPGTTSPGNQSGGPTDPGGGVVQTPRPARPVFKASGTARKTPSPVAGASYATKAFTVPKGMTRTLRVSISDLTGLVAGTGSKGAGFSEYVALQLRDGDGVTNTLFGKLLSSATGAVAAGSGSRYADFAVASFVAGQSRTIVPEGTFIATETAATITHGLWSYVYLL